MASSDPKDYSLETLSALIDKTEKYMDVMSATKKKLTEEACSIQDKINQNRIRLTAYKRARTELLKEQKRATKTPPKRGFAASKGPKTKRVKFDEIEMESASSSDELNSQNGAKDDCDSPPADVDYPDSPSTEQVSDDDSENEDSPNPPGGKAPALHRSLEIEVVPGPIVLSSSSSSDKK